MIVPISVFVFRTVVCLTRRSPRCRSAPSVKVGLRFPAESRKSYFHLSFIFFISRNFGEFLGNYAIFEPKTKGQRNNRSGCMGEGNLWRSAAFFGCRDQGAHRRSWSMSRVISALGRTARLDCRGHSDSHQDQNQRTARHHRHDLHQLRIRGLAFLGHRSRIEIHKDHHPQQSGRP
jgi:hypothetical protein